MIERWTSHFVTSLVIILTLCFPTVRGDGVHIVSHSALVQTVRLGESADFYCESSSPYKYCYWQHNNKDDELYLTTAKGGDATVWGFDWKKTSNRCGIHFQKVEVSQAGTWKCQLADTDAEDKENIRDEREMELEVATPSQVELVLPASLTLRWGEGADLSCQPTHLGWPQPSLRLVRDSRTGERKELASGVNISLTYTPDVQEDGSVFRCLWVQEKGGQLLYTGEEVSEPLEVMVVPAALANTQTYYVFQAKAAEEEEGADEEPLVVRVEFLAKPWPGPGDIRWFSDLANGSRLALEDVEAGLAYQLGGLEAVGAEHSYELATSLIISNLTNNISLVLEISNAAGSSTFYFTVEVPPPPTPPPTSPPPSTAYMDLHALVTPEVYKSNLTAGSVAGLVGGLLFGLILLILSLVLCRQRRSHPTKQRSGESSWVEKEYPLLISDQERIKQNGNSSPLPMSTFGKDARGFNGTLYGGGGGDLVDSAGLRPGKTDLEQVLPSPSSVSTDDLSSLGIRLKEFPDPLASWEDLEPDFNKRRSRHIDSELNLVSPTQPQVRLSGPTGYPVTIQSPRHVAPAPSHPSPRHSQFDVSLPSPRHTSPFTTIQRLHLHVPAERDGKL